MSKTYQKKTAATSDEAVMPPVEAATIALTEIAESAREGLLALPVGTGLQVMRAWMDADVAALCGPRGRHDADRVAYRHGRRTDFRLPTSASLSVSPIQPHA